MHRYLLDTNHLSPAVNSVSPIRERLYRAHRGGLRLGTCIPVLCELETGIQNTARPEILRQQLTHALRWIRIWPLPRELTQHYGEIFHDLRRQGRVLSTVDMMQAALARYMNLTLLTTDRDFEALPDVRTENWLADK